MWEKLKQLARRYDEIGELLEVPEIYADPKKLRALTREQKELLRQLKGIGGNINRLTVLANMGKVQVMGLDKVARELSEVSAALRAVMEGR